MLLVTAAEMQRMDKETIESFKLPGRLLMENAGREAARVLSDTYGGLVQQKVGIMAGRGNNGGDGFVIARCLFLKGVRVTVFLLSEGNKLRGDAAANYDLLRPLGIRVHEIPDAAAFGRCNASMRRQDIWVDAILGTGLKSNVTGFYRRAIDYLNRSGKPVFAVDIPSGLNADTGQPCGACVRAHSTVTFAFAKIGHFTYPGADITGRLEVVDIGIPPHIVAAVNPRQHLLTTDGIRATMTPRPAAAHKGHTGHLVVIGGSPGKTGAAAMAAMSAMRVGAGLVTLGVPASLNPVLECQVLEVMTHPLPENTAGLLSASAFHEVRELLSAKKCLAIGPGMGLSDDTRALVRQLLADCRVPIVIDADGLNCLAGSLEALKKCRCPVILTPHPGEMARLMDTTVAQVQADRISCARQFAQTHEVHVVLKGARTVLANPDGTVFVNPTGNAGMASGGMGDVLTGLIAGLVVQGYSPAASLRIGTYLHGAAADHLAETYGRIGFVASEVMDAIPVIIDQLLEPVAESP